MAALTFAFWLTEQPDWQERFSITILQPGWRLGGKLASGRNGAVGNRIEEHGLHVWSGFYENAFSVIQRVYAALERDPTEPLATWQQAFSPWSDVSWAQRINGSWALLTNIVPGNDTLPGAGGRMATPAGLLARSLSFSVEFLKHRVPGLPLGAAPTGVRALLVKVGLRAFAGLLGAERVIGTTILQLLLWLLSPLIWCMRRLVHGMIAREEGPPGTTYEALAITDLSLAYLEGFTRARVFTRGFDALNGSDLNEWLARSGVCEGTLDSGLIRGIYSYLFAFRDGDTTRPELEAGTAMRMMLRLLLAGSTAIFWRMNAGAGDAVVAPIYQVLAARGVDVRFFHRVTSVGIDASGGVGTLTIGRQATVVGPPGTAYDPLVADGGGLLCWPNTPDYAQLAEGAELQQSGANLESFWADWKDVETLTWNRGEDFDVLVWGASLETLPALAPNLVAASEPLRTVVKAVPTVATQSLQVWLQFDTERLGGPNPATILTAYAEPFDTWADMSHLLGREDWPPIDPPGSIQYFCGVLPAQWPGPDPPDPAYPVSITELVGQAALNYLGAEAVRLWPASASHKDPGTMRWRILHAPAPGDRFAQQFWRANIDPSERYVQSPVGSTEARLPPDGADVDGLLLVGDWLRTGLNYGCIEAAVMSGLQASRVLCGSPEHVYGESDFPPFLGPVP